MTISRRGLLTGLTAALAAPAIVRIDNIMPVRNRLIVPSKLYVTETVYIFSCYLKSDHGPLTIRPSERVQSLSDAGRGWYRYTTEFTSQKADIELPSAKVWGAQVEWTGGGQTDFELKLRNKNGDGVLVMPSTYLAA